MPVATEHTSGTYDPAARRDTPLARKLTARIRASGPMTSADFVTTCLSDPEYGYYVHRPAIGASSDFITAPEISQVFGELIGIWCAVTWHQMGQPSRLNLVELGPGHGTLMADILRATDKVPGFKDALALHLIDSNASLRAAQLNSLATLQNPPTQYSSIEAFRKAASGPNSASIVIGNEFLDAIGVSQLICHQGKWHHRVVCLGETDQLQFGVGKTPAIARSHWPAATSQPDGTIFEFNPALATTIAPLLAELCDHAPCAALFIDYGHEETNAGETLQAIRNHAYEHPLTSPGDADLTAHVDFADAAYHFANAGLTPHGPVTQAEFLGRMGIVERTSKLMAANPSRAAEVEAGVLRLMAPNGMGTRFKVIGAATSALGTLPCLERDSV